MRVSLILLIIILVPSWTYCGEPKNNILILMPSVISAKRNNDALPHEVKFLTDYMGMSEACGSGDITHAKQYRTYSNTMLSTSIGIDEMKIIDPAWQFAEPITLPITLHPGDTITFSIFYIDGYLCEKPAEITERVMFIFSDGNFQKV